jgi:hypothetical protein
MGTESEAFPATPDVIIIFPCSGLGERPINAVIGRYTPVLPTVRTVHHPAPEQKDILTRHLAADVGLLHDRQQGTVPRPLIG